MHSGPAELLGVQHKAGSHRHVAGHGPVPSAVGGHTSGTLWIAALGVGWPLAWPFLGVASAPLPPGCFPQAGANARRPHVGGRARMPVASPGASWGGADGCSDPRDSLVPRSLKGSGASGLGPEPCLSPWGGRAGSGVGYRGGYALASSPPGAGPGRRAVTPYGLASVCTRLWLASPQGQPLSKGTAG